MKKISVIILSMILTISVLISCGKTSENEVGSTSGNKSQSEDIVKKEEGKSNGKNKAKDDTKNKEEDNENKTTEATLESGSGAEVKSENHSSDGSKAQGEVKGDGSQKVPVAETPKAPVTEVPKDPVVETPVAPVPPTPEVPTAKYVTLSITCNTILNNMDKVSESKKNIIPSNGVILGEIKVEIEDGDTVFDVLLKETRGNRIHMDFVETPLYGSAYIKGIANIYEFDAGDLSGWMYSVNGVFPNYGVSKYDLQNGDRIEFKYTCDLGKDL